MPTKNPRVSIPLEPHMMEIVVSLAKQEEKSVAGFAKELLLEALERREDKVLSAIADERDNKKSKKVKHKQDLRKTLIMG